MASNVMRQTKRVRREDLFRNDDLEEAGDDGRQGRDRDKSAQAAARAALEAFMAKTLALDFSLPPPQNRIERAPCTEEKTEIQRSEPKGAAETTRADDDSDDSNEEVGVEPGPRPEERSGATEYVFPLFAPSGLTPKPTIGTGTTNDADASLVKIVLDDRLDADPTTIGPGALLNPPRPLSTYISGPPLADELARYVQVAVRGEDVQAYARPDCRNAWGWEMPWRARTIVRVLSRGMLQSLLRNALPELSSSSSSLEVAGSSDKKKANAPQAVVEDLACALRTAANRLPAWASSTPPIPSAPHQLGVSRHCRPGKKRRIVMRRREQARHEKEAVEAAFKQSKEEHLQEKRKRLNRIKKLRRREKMREAKTSGKGGDDGDDDDDDSGGDMDTNT